MTSVPIGWSEVTLGDVVKLRGEKRQPSESPSALFVGLENVEAHTSRILKYEKAAGMKSAAARFTPGDVLYSRLRPYLNKVFKAEVEGLASAEFLVLKSSPAIEPEYLRRRIMAVDFLDFTAGLDRGDRPRVDYEQISGFDLALPPLAEQRRIVAKLDSLTARTASARAELDHIPRLVEKCKQAILAKAFSGELTKEWRKEQRQQVRWTDCTLADIADDEAPICYGVVQPGEIDVGGVPLVRVCDLSDLLVKWDELRTITGEIESAYARSRIVDGDVLISVVGTIGRIAVVTNAPRAANIARAVARIRPNQTKVLSWWLAYALSDREVQHNLLLETREVARKTLNIEQLKACRLRVPPIPEQDEVVSIIHTAFAWLDKVAAEHARASHLVPKLDQSILAKAFRGELVPQDPNDEPASELLNRLKAGSVDDAAVSKKRRKQSTSCTTTD